jgi:hypothetical protein
VDNEGSKPRGREKGVAAVELGRAFNYIFDDPDWLAKLSIAVVWGFVSLLVPIVIGLIGVAVLLGYMIELVRNVSTGERFPMPRWVDYGRKINDGFSLLVAVFVYNLPNLLIGGCVTTLSGSLGSTLTVGTLCCTIPLLLIYNFIAWSMLAAGVARYVETDQVGEFYRFGALFTTIRQHSVSTIQWVVFGILVNLLFGFLAIIPCCGWVIIMGLSIPIHGHLLGQYTVRIIGRRKRA